MSEREKLTETREGATLHFEILSLTGKADDRRRHLEKIDGYLQTGLYPDGRVGEIFIKIGKNGTEGAVWDAMARNFSIALQFGAPLEVLCSKGVGTQYAPFGPTNIKEIPRCTSVEDLICRWLMMKYGRVEEVVDEQKPKD